MRLAISNAISSELYDDVTQILPGTVKICHFLENVTRTFDIDHFALIRFHSIPQSAYVITSDVESIIVEQLPVEVILSNRSSFSETLCPGGIFNITFAASIQICTDIRLLFLSSREIPHIEGLTPLLIVATQTALKSCPYDTDFLFKRVRSLQASKRYLLERIDFCCDNLNDDEIFELVILMFTSFNIFEEMNVNKDEFVDFLVEIRGLYRQIPYHNWLHAVDVTQFVFSVIIKGNLILWLDKIEIFGLLIAAFCHDVDHDGRNNAFQCKANTILAQLASNSSPLELHHVTLVIKILKSRFPNTLKIWTAERKNTFIQCVINCILMTDMEKHESFLENWRKIRWSYEKHNLRHRMMLIQLIIKTADLSNVVRKFETASAMTSRLMEEMFLQGDTEKELGLEISPMCDRLNAIPIAQSQCQFYRFVAGPLLLELRDFVPNLTEYTQQYEANLDRWTFLLTSQ